MKAITRISPTIAQRIANIRARYINPDDVSQDDYEYATDTGAYDPDPQPSDLTPTEDMPIGSLARMVEELESSPTALAEHFNVPLDTQGAPISPEYPDGDFPEGWPPKCQWCGAEVLSDSIPYCSDDCRYEATHRPNDTAPAERAGR